ncbi:hypothetical protein AGABI1DRAFT_85477, partial [Agaricus bisporus var. burnettii JB137-S8]
MPVMLIDNSLYKREDCREILLSILERKSRRMGRHVEYGFLEISVGGGKFVWRWV